MVSAFATRGPMGPIMAILNVQSIILTIFQAVKTLALPNWMQMIGLVFGIIGGLTLAVPDFMKKICVKIFRCK